MNTLQHILHHKIVAIVRGMQPGDLLPVAEALYAGGIRSLEVTLNSSGALEVIKQLSDVMKDKMQIGAGTVLSASEAEEAVKAGARFIISPNVDVETITMTKQLGVVSIPGAFTATEIVLAHKTGADIIKIFPATGNIDYIKNLRGPLPHIPLMPTGGVGLENIAEFKKAGAVAYGIGSTLVSSGSEINDVYLKELSIKAKQLVDAIA
jgi:2-dehydro-3-deoxyphosphogluconate aldolase / (4S)-4-hydroxy-2-oxoglutarate aldolase